MTNWSNFATGAGARVTTWNYDPYRGFLAGKADASGQGATYACTGAGRLAARTWARGTNAAYAYDTAGDLISVTYNDSVTPAVTNSYDGAGRVSAVMCGGMTTSFVYDWANDVLSESYAGGILGGLRLTNQFDACLRRTNVALLNGSSALCRAIYGYDNASRLASVSDGTNSAAYSYLANSSLVGQIVFSQSGATKMTTSKQYDYLNRLSSIASTPSNTFAYQYNAANQRTMNRLWDGSYWRYNYDALGQVTLGSKYWVDQTPVAGQQFDYTFDTIGNRTQTLAGGDQNGANLRLANDTNNTLNQITSRSVPGYVDIMGDGLATNGVTVNGLAAYRKGEYFREQLGVTNTAAAVWDGVTVAAAGQGSVTGHIYVPETPEIYSYDLDGNLLSDGRWSYAWDGENRLIGMTSLSNAPNGSQMQLVFTYDYQGRRIQKMVFTNNAGTYVGDYTNNYAYDGWNCLAILNATGLLDSFMWGSDLSGSVQGAGGVGGLIKVAYYGTSTTNCFVAFDGNGNVSALVNAADGITLANYEYGPFGEVIRASGPMAKLNPFTFQTEYYDWETDKYYWKNRFYDPSPGRWLSRDPLGDQAFFAAYSQDKSEWEQYCLLAESHLPPYTFVGNDGINGVDVNGLDRWHVDVLHTYVVVEVWDKCCQNVTGYMRIEFSPRNGWVFVPPFFTSPGLVTITPCGKPSGWNVAHISSSCNADKILLGWAYDMQKNPPIYNFWVYNCRTFSAYAQNVGLGY